MAAGPGIATQGAGVSGSGRRVFRILITAGFAAAEHAVEEVALIAVLAAALGWTLWRHWRARRQPPV
jgi:hypothetical protein